MGAKLLKALYWLAVLAVSLLVVVLLILFFESRDEGSLSGGVVIGAPATRPGD